MEKTLTEDQFQAMEWQWVWNTLPECRLCLWAIPNGGEQTWQQAKLFQATGRLAGVWDMCLHWAGQYHWIEFKVGGNGLTLPQKAWRNKMIEQGETNFLVVNYDHDGSRIFREYITRIIRGLPASGL